MIQIQGVPSVWTGAVDSAEAVTSGGATALAAAGGGVASMIGASGVLSVGCAGASCGVVSVGRATGSRVAAERVADRREGASSGDDVAGCVRAGAGVGVTVGATTGGSAITGGVTGVVAGARYTFNSGPCWRGLGAGVLAAGGAMPGIACCASCAKAGDAAPISDSDAMSDGRNDR